MYQLVILCYNSKAMDNKLTAADEFYTLKEVAERLHVSRMTVYRYVKAKKLPAYKIGRDFRIKGGDLNTFISSLKF